MSAGRSGFCGVGFFGFRFRVVYVVLGYRGDYTYVECCLIVVVRGIEVVVFSIDGFFIVSVFIMGSDFKVRVGVVDVVR